MSLHFWMMFVVAGSNPCPECGKCFFRPEVLKVHLRDVHENKGKLFICELCDKTSTSLNGLGGTCQCITGTSPTPLSTRWTRSKNLWTPWTNLNSLWTLCHYFPGEQNICLSCGKHFSRRDAMLVHFRDIHQNAGKTFVCELCNKTCKSLQALKMHNSKFHKYQ